MATSRTAVHCLIHLAVTILVGQATRLPKPVTIDAAINLPISPNFLVLFHGNYAIVIPTAWGSLHNYEEYFVHNRSRYYIPLDMNIKAAYVNYHGTHYDIQAFGDKYRCIISLPKGALFKFYYKPEFEFIMDGGPDAAAKRRGNVIFFKGCKMKIRNGPRDWEEAEDVEPIGLPCYPDAAWEDGKNMIILKGDQIWKWQDDGIVDGPTHFNKTYTLYTRILIPSDGCPEGWHGYKEAKICIKIGLGSKTWQEARTACQDVGADLIKIPSYRTLYFVNALPPAQYWIGLNDIKQEGKFVWLDEDKLARFVFWAGTQPDHQAPGEDCVFTGWKKKYDVWHDVSCEIKMNYLCQLHDLHG